MTVTLLKQTLELSFLDMYTEQWFWHGPSQGLMYKDCVMILGTMLMISITTLSINPTALFTQQWWIYIFYCSESLITGQLRNSC